MKRASAGLLIAALVAFAPGRPCGGDPFPELGPLPPPPVPLDNPITPAKVELGKLLFFERRIAAGISEECGGCHEPVFGWGDDLAISRGSPGTVHYRNSQTVLNAAYYERLFWDGGARSLEEQAAAALSGALSQNSDPSLLEETLAQIPEYRRRFKEVFGAERPRFADAVKAIAAFERAELVSRGSSFDAYARGDVSALSEAARRGLSLFKGKAGCIRCHNGALFSDQGFHATGVPENPFLRDDPLAQITLRFAHAARGAARAPHGPEGGDPGLYFVTKRAEDRGRFRTPSLRELKHTAPYMHNGVFDTLDEVVDFYDRGGGAAANKSALLAPLGLTPAEKRELIAFLESASGAPILVEDPDTPPFEAAGRLIPAR